MLSNAGDPNLDHRDVDGVLLDVKVSNGFSRGASTEDEDRISRMQATPILRTSSSLIGSYSIHVQGFRLDAGFCGVPNPAEALAFRRP
jgi:hypothetical protein